MTDGLDRDSSERRAGMLLPEFVAIRGPRCTVASLANGIIAHRAAQGLPAQPEQFVPNQLDRRLRMGASLEPLLVRYGIETLDPEELRAFMAAHRREIENSGSVLPTTLWSVAAVFEQEGLISDFTWAVDDIAQATAILDSGNFLARSYLVPGEALARTSTIVKGVAGWPSGQSIGRPFVEISPYDGSVAALGSDRLQSYLTYQAQNPGYELIGCHVAD